MAWIANILAALVVFVILRLVGRWLVEEASTRRPLGRALQWAAIAIAVLWIGFDTVFASVHEIPAGHVAVVYEFGAIRGQISEGFNVIPPWRTIKDANIQVQRHFFDKLNAFSQETQDVFVAATLNIRVSPNAIQELYRSVGPNYFDILVAPRVAQNFKDETVKYKSVDIAPNRETIRRAVRERLEGELSRYSIEVEDLLLEDIDFNPGFKSAIEAKQIATQRALEEEQKVLVSRNQAQQAIEKARGDGEAILIIAEKQAEANQALGASLTPTLVQYALVQKLGDQISVILLPSEQNLILDSSLLKPPAEP